MRKTILITGASTGIGKAGALELGRRGWKVFVHARSVARGNLVLDEMKQKAPNADFSLVTGDVSAMAEVKSLAEQVKAQTKTLDVLWNNAGLMLDEYKVSVDGWEMTMAINHLAPFVLTRELLPLIEQTQGRVITTSSGAYVMGRFNWDDWMDEKSTYNSFKAYSKSKLANILFMLTPQAGADTAVYLAEDPSAKNSNGKYWAKRKVRNTNRNVNDLDASKLWELSEKATN